MARRRKGVALSATAVLASVVFACCSCGAPSLKPATVKKLDAALLSVMSQYEVPGALAGAWVEGQGSWTAAKGKADVANGEPMRPDLKFRIGSSTKTFVATVVLQLSDEGKLSLDDPLGKYQPGYPDWSGVTVRQLLNMTSGIYNYTDDEAFATATASDPLKKWSPEQLLDIAASHQDYFPPGGGWAYSNTDYILLGLLIEKVTGNGVATEIEGRIIDKLGLKNTGFPSGPDMTGSYSHGYRDDPATGKLSDITRIDPSQAWTAGAMVSDMPDLKAWAEALSRGSLLSRKAFNEQMTFIPTGMPFVGYGLGVFKVNKYVGHGGSIFGYDSAMFSRASDGRTVVCMVNKNPVNAEGRAVAMTDLFNALAGPL